MLNFLPKTCHITTYNVFNGSSIMIMSERNRMKVYMKGKSPGGYLE